MLFLLDQDLFFHVLGRRTRPAGTNGDGAYLEIRNHLHRYAQNRDDAEHTHDQHRDGEEQAALEDGFEHGAVFAFSRRLPRARVGLLAASHCRV